MILSIYLTMIGIALLLTLIGFYTEKAYLTVTGYVFLMLLGLPLISGIEYQNGSTITSAGATTTITPVYSTYQNTTIGIMFSTVFGLAFALTLLEFKPGRN